jgi:alpha-ribazole phosphatase
MTENSKYNIIRWWWVRHALVEQHSHKGLFYGGSDVDCTPNANLSKWLSSTLPNNVDLITSKLKRCTQTANAISDEGLKFKSHIELANFNEQSFGDWEKLKFEQVYKNNNRSSVFWWAPAHTKISGGESFAQLYARVSSEITEINHTTIKNHFLTDNQTTTLTKDIIIVAHGGTIRAAIAFALGIGVESSLNINIDNQSVSLLEYFQENSPHATKDRAEDANLKTAWRSCYINRLPNHN